MSVEQCKQKCEQTEMAARASQLSLLIMGRSAATGRQTLIWASTAQTSTPALGRSPESCGPPCGPQPGEGRGAAEPAGAGRGHGVGRRAGSYGGSPAAGRYGLFLQRHISSNKHEQDVTSSTKYLALARGFRATNYKLHYGINYRL
jgi:hypothetical protein